MKKLRRILVIALSAVVILVVIVAAVVNILASKALSTVIETSGSKALSVPVNIGKVDLAVLRGKLGLQNLVIDNPPGYQHERLLELGEGHIDLELKSLLSDIVNIRDISLDGIEVALEQKGTSGNNLQDIIKNLPRKDKDEQKSEPTGKKLHIDTLELTNVTVKAKLLPLPGKRDTVTLKLAPIKMTDLGGDNDLDTAALSRTLLLAIAKGIAEHGAGILPDDMLGSLSSELKQLGALSDSLVETGKRLRDAVTDTGEEGEGTGKKVVEGLKGLLEKKKEQD